MYTTLIQIDEASTADGVTPVGEAALYSVSVTRPRPYSDRKWPVARYIIMARNGEDAVSQARAENKNIIPVRISANRLESTSVTWRFHSYDKNELAARGVDVAAVLAAEKAAKERWK